jgi:hypothetical protein
MYKKNKLIIATINILFLFSNLPRTQPYCGIQDEPKSKPTKCQLQLTHFAPFGVGKVLAEWGRWCVYFHPSTTCKLRCEAEVASTLLPSKQQ